VIIRSRNYKLICEAADCDMAHSETIARGEAVDLQRAALTRATKWGWHIVRYRGELNTWCPEHRADAVAFKNRTGAKDFRG